MDQFIQISDFVEYHVPSGLFICFECNDGFAFDKSAMQTHLHKNHSVSNFAEMVISLQTILVNTNIPIPRLKPKDGLKCSNCGLLSKYKTAAQFRQWHFKNCADCKDALVLSVPIQIRGGIIFEMVAQTPVMQNFLTVARLKYSAQQGLGLVGDDRYTSNPLQIYFNIFTVFGNTISYDSLSDYKIHLNGKEMEAVVQCISNHLKSFCNRLVDVSAIRAIMGVDGQMFHFKRSDSSFDSLAKLWAKILAITAFSKCELYGVREAARKTAVTFLRVRTGDNLKQFLREVLPNNNCKVVETSGRVVSVADKWHDHFIIRVLFLIHFNKTGDFSPAKNLTPSWAQVEFTYKVLLGCSIFERFNRTLDVEVVQHSEACQMVEEFNHSIWFTNLTAVHGQLKSVTNLAKNTSVTIVQTSNADVVKISNLDISFTKQIRGVIIDFTQNVLNQWMGIMKTVLIVPIPDILRDDLTNINNGYSFATDSNNSEMMRAIAQNVDNQN